MKDYLLPALFGIVMVVILSCVAYNRSHVEKMLLEDVEQEITRVEELSTQLADYKTGIRLYLEDGTLTIEQADAKLTEARVWGLELGILHLQLSELKGKALKQQVQTEEK